MEFIVVFLVILLIIQQCFYMWQTNKLVNKLMSRNYGEYLATEQSIKSQPNIIKMQVPVDDGPDQVQTLNRMFGL